MTMPGLVLTADRRIEAVQRARPTLRADQVIVEIDLCGICGSDLHSPDLPQVYVGDRILGHESTGGIAAIGAGVTGWAVGQRVAVNPNGNVCGRCVFCLTGRPNFCHQATMETALGLQADGALAPVMAAFAGNLRAIPEGMGRVEAAWVEPAATALRAVQLAGDLGGRSVLVTGGGPIGQLACRIAHAKGAGQLWLMEPAAERAAFAAASHAVAVAPDELLAQVGESTVDVVIECSGNAEATRAALRALGPGGVLVVVGAGPGSGLDPATVLLKEITVRGSFTYTDEFDRAIGLLADGTVEVTDLTTMIVPLQDAMAAFAELRAGRTMKALIAPNQ
jgi:threonine dehydrogenase-like Zn-dependent dehydrogenase